MARRAVIRVFATTLALVIAIAHRGQCQPSAPDVLPWTAVMATPLGALPSIAVPLSRESLGEQTLFGIRSSRWSLPRNVANHVFGFTALRRTATNNLLIGTAGVFHPGCDCDDVFMVGIDGIRAGRSHDFTPRLSGGINAAGSFGYGRDRYRGYTSGSLSLPMELTANAGRHLVSLSLRPGLAMGMADNASGVLKVYSGSLSWLSTGGVGIHLNANRIQVAKSLTNAGIALTLRR